MIYGPQPSQLPPHCWEVLVPPAHPWQHLGGMGMAFSKQFLLLRYALHIRVWPGAQPFIFPLHRRVWSCGWPLLFKIKKPGGSFVLKQAENQSICPVLGGRRKQQSSVCWKFPHLKFCFAWVEGNRSTRQKEDKNVAEGWAQRIQVMKIL